MNTCASQRLGDLTPLYESAHASTATRAREKRVLLAHLQTKITRLVNLQIVFRAIHPRQNIRCYTPILVMTLPQLRFESHPHNTELYGNLLQSRASQCLVQALPIRYESSQLNDLLQIHAVLEHPRRQVDLHHPSSLVNQLHHILK